MPENNKTELQRLEILRLSNEESNHITRSCIESAMLILLKDECFHKITITDIVKRAGVSRTAYYRNYTSKDDILRQMMRGLTDTFMADFKLFIPVKNSYDSWNHLFRSVEQHADFFIILLNANLGDIILEEIHQKVVSHLEENRMFETFSAFFWIGAIYNVAAVWLRNGMQQSVEEMAEICYQIVNHVLEPCMLYKEP
jgi:AcrR family transcriptional regulator